MRIVRIVETEEDKRLAERLAKKRAERSAELKRIVVSWFDDPPAPESKLRVIDDDGCIGTDTAGGG